MRRYYTMTRSRRFCLALVCLSRIHIYAHSPDVTSHERNEKNVSSAILGTVNSNMVIWGWDRFIVQADWAKVGPTSWEKNLREGFEWDNSWFFTNQILHPYQGSMYFNSARENGLSFWESVPFSASGSLMWEYFLETGNPSINDLITTTLGGIALGESSYRLTELLLNYKGSGYKRVMAEAVSGLINPISGTYRLINGQIGTRSAMIHRPYYDIEIQNGIVMKTSEGYDTFKIPSLNLGAWIQYGNLHDSTDTYMPYDYFNYSLSLNVNPDEPTGTIFMKANIFGKSLYLAQQKRFVAGVFQHFDYIENFTYKYASNSLGVGIEGAFGSQGPLTLEYTAHLLGTALGVINSKITKKELGTDYSYGQGWGVKNSFAIKYKTLGRVSATYNKYYQYTLRGFDSYNTVDVASISFDMFLTNIFQFGVGAFHYVRESDMGIDNHRSIGTRVYIIHKL